jgi:glycosyltransferase involved in cell wall biosynthesis
LSPFDDLQRRRSAPRNADGGSAASVAFLLKGYPRLSETFIAQEIRSLERRGLGIVLFSMRRPTDGAIHPVHREITAPVTYLPEYLHEAPITVLRAWRSGRSLPGYAAAIAAFRRDFARDRSRSRVRRLGQALVLAACLPASVRHLHAHFLHTPASVVRYASLLTGLSWSVSAHAKDIWTTPDWDKAEKLAECDWAVTCTQAGHHHLASLTAQPERLGLSYHGLDLTRFPLSPPAYSMRDGGDPDQPVRLVSVGRLVPKKGYPTLLRALALLPARLHWRLCHIGGGNDAAQVRRLANELDLTHRIDWHGAQPQEAVLDALRQSDLFVLACRVADDGDRDGLPNVLLEAQSQGLPVVATTAASIPELIADRQNGLLAPPDKPALLAEALARAIADPALRARLGSDGRRRVVECFDHAHTIEDLAARFGVAGDGGACASRSTPR